MMTTIGDFNDTALTKLFEERVRVRFIDDCYMFSIEGGDWQYLMEARDHRDKKLPWLKLVEDFCQGLARELEAEDELTDRIKLKLGSITTFRKIHKLTKWDREASQAEEDELEEQVWIATMKKFSLPLGEFTIARGTGNRKRDILYQGKPTPFYIDSKEMSESSKDYTKSYYDPLRTIYKFKGPFEITLHDWIVSGEASTEQEALAGLKVYIQGYLEKAQPEKTQEDLDKLIGELRPEGNVVGFPKKERRF